MFKLTEEENNKFVDSLQKLTNFKLTILVNSLLIHFEDIQSNLQSINRTS